MPRCAANARTLIEQSIDVAYGCLTANGQVAAVDRLNIVAHDKFQEIIDEANRGDSPIRLKQVILEAPSADDKKVSVQVGAGVMERLGLAESTVMTPGTAEHGEPVIPTPVFKTEAEKQVVG